MSIYYLFYVIGFTAIIILDLLMAPKYNFKRSIAFVHIVLCCITDYLLMLLLYYIINGSFGGQNMVRLFVFIPLVNYLFGRILNMQIDKLMDFIAPLSPILLGFAKIGCLLSGCCRSWIQVDWGIYNHYTKTMLFPVQLFEAITAFLIALIVWLVARKNNYNAKGRTMPLMLFLFGITRFAWEFFRDNTKLFLGISELAIWALASAIMGGVWFVWSVYHEEDFEEKQNEPYYYPVEGEEICPEEKTTL